MRSHARRDFVGDRAKEIHVGTLIVRADCAVKKLGRKKTRSAHELSFLRLCWCELVAVESDAPIENEHLSKLTQHHVARLNVTMNHAGRVSADQD